MSSPGASVEHINELIAFFGEHEKAALRAEQRGALRSRLFDLPRRSVLGWQMKYEHEPAFLREVATVLSPEDVAHRMRIPGSRPYYLQLFLMLQDTLGARQQRMLELGLREGEHFAEERLDDLAFMVDFWERCSRAYRSDGGLLPDGARPTQPILSEQTLDQVRELLTPVRAQQVAAARRLAAMLEAYCFVAHGEQRDGTFGHGPYAGRDGRVLFFKEFNDLRNDFLPWTRTVARNVHENVVFAYECSDVGVACNMFAGIVTDPLEFHDRIECQAVLTQEGGELRPLDPGEWETVGQCASEATNEIFLSVVDWPARYRVEYGSMLFANHIRPFMSLAGIDADGRLAAAAGDTVDRHLDALRTGPDTPATMVHWGTTEGPLFWPVVA